MRPKIPRETAFAYIEAAGLSLDKEPVIVLGIRGGLEAGIHDNVIGTFDDLIAVVSSDVCEGFTGNTDPSTQIPGRATLISGVWRFKPGPHHVGKPNEYPAFVQASPVTVQRYQQGRDTGMFAIHIHNAMGVNTTGSEGCQTIIKTEWDSFHSLVSLELDRNGRRDFPYVLVDRLPIAEAA